jgi:hypothetical protein
MPTPAAFHRQLEALLMIPPAQARAPGREARANEPPAAPAQPVAEAAPSAPPSPRPEAPTYLRSETPAWALAETGLALALPIPRDPLPFVDPSEVVGGLAAPVAAPRRPPPEPSPSGTLEVSALPIPRDVLPFGPLLPIPPGVAGNDVAATSLLLSLPIPRDPLPFEREAAEPAIQGMTLPAYARLCAALAAPVVDAEAIFAAHGLPEPARRRVVDAAWRAHLARDPAAYARWQDLYRRHLAGAR